MFRAVILLLGICVGSTTAYAQTITVEQANKAVDDAVARKLIDVSNQHIRATKILGCIPAAGKPKGIMVCPLMTNSSDTPDNISFKFHNSEWTILGDDDKPSCPPLKVAESEFRKLRNLSSLRVTDEVDDGEGTLTDERGISRNKKGPHRIMCRYEVQVGKSEYLYIAYTWYNQNQYVIDNDIEIWPN